MNIDFGLSLEFGYIVYIPIQDVNCLSSVNPKGGGSMALGLQNIPINPWSILKRHAIRTILYLGPKYIPRSKVTI